MGTNARTPHDHTRNRMHIGTRRLRRRAMLAVVCSAVLGGALALATGAAANLPGSTFEGADGNLVVNSVGNTDWANVGNVNKGIDQPTGSNDNAFGQGTKEDSAATQVVDGSIPPNKNDLIRFYEASQLVGGKNYLELAWRRLVNIGNANLDFEISQNATAGFTGATTGSVTLNRTAGDLLISYDFGGSGNPTLGLNLWLTAAAGNTVSQCFSANSLPCWGKHVDLSGAGDAEGAVNAAAVVDPLDNNASLGTGLFGEAAINLTDAGVFPSGTCKAFGSAFVKSRSSSSFTAEIKDFIAPVPVNISNCGSITVKKVTQNEPTPGSTSFSYGATNLTPTTFNLTGGGTPRMYPSVPAGSYSVTEGTLPSGWDFVGVNCTTDAAANQSAYTGQTANLTLASAENVVCTYTNHYTNSPSIRTSLSRTTANTGDSVHDSATLTGASANAGGTVTYKVFAGTTACPAAGTTPVATSTVTVTNAVVPDSDAFTLNAAGAYSVIAVYSGDANNNAAFSGCTDEPLLIKTNPTIGTTLSDTTIEVGASAHDSSSLSGATSDAGGTVTYTVYSDRTCTTTFAAAGTRTVTNGVVPNSNSITFSATGTYYWQAVYSGDSKNNGATSACTDEILTVNPKHPSASTAQNLLPNDSFTLSGATSTAGGSITFGLYAPGDTTCSGSAAYTQTVSVSGNGTYSTTNATFMVTDTGTWRWASSYSGDGNNTSAASTCGTEQFTFTNG